MKIIPQKDAMDGFFAVLLRRKWFYLKKKLKIIFFFYDNIFNFVYISLTIIMKKNIECD